MCSVVGTTPRADGSDSLGAAVDAPCCGRQANEHNGRRFESAVLRMAYYSASREACAALARQMWRCLQEPRQLAVGSSLPFDWLFSLGSRPRHATNQRSTLLVASARRTLLAMVIEDVVKAVWVSITALSKDNAWSLWSETLRQLAPSFPRR